MYPAVRKSLDNGDQLADKELEDHGEVERLLKRLENMDLTNQEFDQLLAELIKDVRQHVSDEENNLLPKLRSACSQEELRDLGQKVLRAKKMARRGRTRAHRTSPLPT